jgi:hypothetical protein
MSGTRYNRYRAAMDVLQKGRDMLVDELADQIVDQADDLLDGGYAFNEFLETQGTRLHFLGLLMAQLEQSAEALDETHAPPAPPPPTPPETPKPRRRRSRSKKLPRQTSPEGSPDDV